MTTNFDQPFGSYIDSLPTALPIADTARVYVRQQGRSFTVPVSAMSSNNRGVLTLFDFGAVGDGSTNDTAAFNDAVEDFQSQGGGTIFCPKGDYLITEALTQWTVPIMWQGEVGTRFLCQPGADNVTFFSQRGTTTSFASVDADSVMVESSTYPINNTIACSSTTNFTSGCYAELDFTNPVTGLEVIAVFPVRNFTSSTNKHATLNNVLSCTAGSPLINVHYVNHGRQVGDPVVIYSYDVALLDNQIPAGYYDEVVQVVDADNFKVQREENFNNTVTNGGGNIEVILYSIALVGHFPAQIQTVASVKSILPFTPIIGGGFRDIDFVCTNNVHDNTVAVESSYTANQVYENLKFYDFHPPTFHTQSGGAIVLSSGYANYARNIYAENCGSAGTCDITFSHQTRLTGGGIRSSNAFDNGPGYQFCSHCHLDDVQVDSCGSRVFRFAFTHMSSVGWLSTMYGGFTGPAFNGGSMNNYIGNVITMGDRDANLWHDSSGNMNNHIGRVVSAGCFVASANFQYFPNDTGNTVESIKAVAGYNGGQARIGKLPGLRTVTSSTDSLTQFDTDIICSFAGTVTLTLLSAELSFGQPIVIKTTTNNTVVSGSSNVVPIIGGSAGTAILPATAGKWARLQSDGTNWVIMASG